MSDVHTKRNILSKVNFLFGGSGTTLRVVSVHLLIMSTVMSFSFSWTGGGCDVGHFSLPPPQVKQPPVGKLLEVAGGFVTTK